MADVCALLVLNFTFFAVPSVDCLFNKPTCLLTYVICKQSPALTSEDQLRVAISMLLTTSSQHRSLTSSQNTRWTRRHTAPQCPHQRSRCANPH